MIKNDVLDALIVCNGNILIADNLSVFQQTEFTTTYDSIALDQKIFRMIRRERLKIQIQKIPILAQKIAALFLVVCMVSLSSLLSVKDVRIAFANAVIDYYNNHIAEHCIQTNTTHENKIPNFIYDKNTVFAHSRYP